jgi:DNA-binding CsgD family transcriptional regulator/tetratricopeptide (TPR) repeat protein
MDLRLGQAAGGRSGQAEAGPERVVGRAGELSVIAGLADRVAAGGGGVLVVVGEQGIGKSALLRTGLAPAREAGCQVASAAADELDQPFPLRFIDRCLAGVAGRSPAEDASPGTGARRLLLGGISSDDLRLAGTERVLAAVVRLCERSPLVLVAEDLHWADEASLGIWERLIPVAGKLPLLLAGSFRPVPVRPELEKLRQEAADGRGTVLELGPLSAAGVTELAGDLLGARPGRALSEVVDRAGGNPLYIRELLDALVRDGRVAVDKGLAELAGESGGVPQTLAAAIDERLEVLPREALQVLRCAAVLGLEFSVTELALVASRPAREAAELVRQAAVAGVVSQAAEGTAAFRHGLIRQAVYDGIPGPVRAALHRQAAQALARAGAAPARVAAHLMAAPGLAEWKLDWLCAAGRTLVYQAPGVAKRLLRSALAVLPSEDPRRENLEANLLEALLVLGEREEVERLAAPLLARTTDLNRYAQVSWQLSSGLLSGGRAAEGIAAAGQALAQPGISAAWTARLLALQALGHVYQGEPERGDQVARQALAIAALAGDQRAAGYAWHHRARAALRRRDQAAALAYEEKAVEALRGEPEGSTNPKLIMMASRANLLAEADRLEEAGVVIREAMALAEQIGTFRLGSVCGFAADHYLEVGQWDDALAVLESVSGLDRDDYIAALVDGLAALIAAHRDDRAALGRYLERAQHLDTASPTLQSVSHPLLLARALAAEREGDLAGAVRTLAACLAPEAAGMTERYLLLPPLVRLATAAGDAETARAAAEAAAADASAGLPVAMAAADVCRGVAGSDPEPVLSAAVYYESTGRPLARAQALEEAAVLLAPSDEEAARRSLVDAAAIYEALGAIVDLRRMDARLRALGIRRGRIRRRDVPDSGWAALTPTEQAVARMAAEGRSNPDIAAELRMSRSTVQTHMSHILAKLGARSRGEIAAYVVSS